MEEIKAYFLENGGEEKERRVEENNKLCESFFLRINFVQLPIETLPQLLLEIKTFFYFLAIKVQIEKAF